MKRGWNNLTMLLLLAALAAPATAFAEESGSAKGEKNLLLIINVTAQKRTEAENTVPISLDIATPDQMKAEHIYRYREAPYSNSKRHDGARQFWFRLYDLSGDPWSRFI